MLLHIPFTLFCVISFVNANFQHSTFPFSQHIASKIPVCSRDYQKHVGMKSPDYSRRPSLYNNSSNYHQDDILYTIFNYFTTLTMQIIMTMAHEVKWSIDQIRFFEMKKKMFSMKMKISSCSSVPLEMFKLLSAD